jgi:PAS domain S-box-containing protein
MEHDLLGALVTTALVAVVALGYAAIAFNWFFQSRLGYQAEPRAALRHLRAVVLCSAAAGALFALPSTGWSLWPAYAAALAALGAYTWWVAVRMRGMSLVQARVADAAEAERAAARYREVAEFLPTIVWTADGGGRVDFSNHRWRQYAGDDHTWLDALHPDDRPAVRRWWADALAAGLAVSREARLRAADGAYRTFLINATPSRTDGGAVRWFGACADVEDQKRTDAEREAQAKRKAFFFNALSHDLRAPLNNVVLNAELLKMSVSDNPDVNESAETVVENARAAGDMVAKLLEFARAGSQVRNDLSPVRLDDLLQQVGRRFYPIAAAKRLTLRVLGAAAVEVHTDRLKLERIISNLVDNAIKFTPAGGITLELHHHGPSGVSVHIADTGVGIPEQDVPHLFDEFYQAHNHEPDRNKGFGMGLAICRSLARQIGGDVRLARTGPTGSCFEVLVPSGAPRDRDQHPVPLGHPVTTAAQ